MRSWLVEYRLRDTEYQKIGFPDWKQRFKKKTGHTSTLTPLILILFPSGAPPALDKEAMNARFLGPPVPPGGTIRTILQELRKLIQQSLYYGRSIRPHPASYRVPLSATAGTWAMILANIFLPITVLHSLMICQIPDVFVIPPGEHVDILRIPTLLVGTRTRAADK